MMKRYLLTALFCSLVAIAYAAQPLKVLAIGNSFSEDATEQDLSAMAALGGHDIIIGNLYYPACSIERHWNNLINDRGDYSFRKIYTDGKADTISNCTLIRALREESWDIITFQQGSAVSGIYSSYRYLPALIKRVRQIVGSHPKFLWHQTWAYAPGSSHPGFKKYSGDQMRMYAAILYCTKRVLADNPELKGLIPTGTAIQDARTSFLGDDLTRDGYHLDLTVGRYIASCTWYGVLFSKPFSIATYLPEGMTLREGEICRKAAQEAIRNPYRIVDINLPAPDHEEVAAYYRKRWQSGEIKDANPRYLSSSYQNLVKRENIEVNVCLDNIKFVTLRRNVSVNKEEALETLA